jgi:carboxypeptidase-like protein
MINMQNRLGTTRYGSRRGVVLGIAIALMALALLVEHGHAQSTPGSQDTAGEERGEAFTLLGSLVDSNSGEALAGAWIGLTGTDWGSITNEDGRFRIPETIAGRVSLTIELLAYEKLEWVGDVDADDVLVIELNPQPIVLEGLRVVTDRFRSRRNATATSVFAYNADDMASTTTTNALEFIEFSSAAWLTPCNGRRSDRCLFVRGRTVEPTVYVDEMPVLGGLSYLESFRPWEFHLIEVYGGGRHIRAYTPGYMERAAKNRISPIALPF